MHGTHSQLRERLRAKDEEIAARDDVIASRDAKIKELRKRIDLLEKALFGPKSERIVGGDENQQEFEGLLKELREAADELGDIEDEPSKGNPKRRPKRRKRRRKLEELVPDDLPEEEILVDVPEGDRINLETGEPMVKIREERSRKLAFRPGHYIWRVYVRPVYAAKGDPGQGVQQSPMPDLAVPGSEFDESLMAKIVVDKCAYHLPLYRQEEKMHHLGIGLSRQTLCWLYMRSAEVLDPLYDLMVDNVRHGGVLFTDDTPVKLIEKGKGKTTTGRMWIYVGGGNSPPYRVFDFTRDRKKERPQNFLGDDFSGYIHADAYPGYDKLFMREDVHECACWMHVRRKFVEATDGPPELRDDVLRWIRHLYLLEKVIRDQDPTAVVRIRNQKVRPIIDRIFTRCRQAVASAELLPSSAMAGAIGYLQSCGQALYTFLDDARLKPDNGESERAIRPLAIGRKNWLFAGSKAGGRATAVLLSLIQSCRHYDKDPFEYLTDVLRRINGHPASKLDQLLPDKWQPPAAEE